MIQVTFQFKTIEEAVATLGTLLQRGAPVPNVDKPAVDLAAKSNRKPRADAGKKRGSYKNVEPVAAATAGAPVAEQTTAADSAPETAAPPDASLVIDQPPPAVTEATGPADAAAPDEKAVQAALDKMFTAKGLKPTMTLLNEFGVAKGRDLKPEQRADFIARAEEAAK